MSTAIQTRRKPKPGAVEQARRAKQRLDANPPSKTKIAAVPIVSPYLTTEEAAAYLKLSRQFLEGARYRDDGTGPPYVKAGKTVRYIQSALDAWMTAQIRAPKPAAK
jgi:predicted DNA-binding transcriptional regulator AlpA